MKRRAFLRWALGSLLAGWIGLRLPELELEELPATSTETLDEVMQELYLEPILDGIVSSPFEELARVPDGPRIRYFETSSAWGRS